MPPRFVYRRLTASEFLAELNRQGMTHFSFARIFGANLRTVEKWAYGQQDIPPWVPVALTLLSLDGGLGTARMAASLFIEEDTRHPELGPFPYKTLRDLPADAEQGE